MSEPDENLAKEIKLVMRWIEREIAYTAGHTTSALFKYFDDQNVFVSYNFQYSELFHSRDDCERLKMEYFRPEPWSQDLPTYRATRSVSAVNQLKKGHIPCLACYLDVLRQLRKE